MTWFDEWKMGRDIREGRVAMDLARPMDFQAKRFADAIGPSRSSFARRWSSPPSSPSRSAAIAFRPTGAPASCS